MKKVLLITGASGGIGKAIATHAAAKGYAICLHYKSNHEEANRLMAKLKAEGCEVIIAQADLTQEEQVTNLFNQIRESLGKVTALVNNAGCISPISKLVEMEATRIKQLFEDNVLSSFLCAREAIKHMSTRLGGDGGNIVNISSAASRIGSPNEFIDYAATKGAIDTFTMGLAKEVAEEGIRVNAVRPGLIDTELHAKCGVPDRAEALKNNIPMKRVGSTDEVAKSVIWLLSDDASYVTGSLLDVTGGR